MTLAVIIISLADYSTPSLNNRVFDVDAAPEFIHFAPTLKFYRIHKVRLINLLQRAIKSYQCREKGRSMENYH